MKIETINVSELDSHLSTYLSRVENGERFLTVQTHVSWTQPAIQTSRDIAAILKSKKNELDMNYIEQWVARLGLSSLWKEMLDYVS